MSGLTIALISAYVVIAIAVAVVAWKLTFSDHLGDPLLASLGLLLSIALGAIWIGLLAASPFILMMYGIGKLIVASGER